MLANSSPMKPPPMIVRLGGTRPPAMCWMVVES